MGGLDFVDLALLLAECPYRAAVGDLPPQRAQHLLPR